MHGLLGWEHWVQRVVPAMLQSRTFGKAISWLSFLTYKSTDHTAQGAGEAEMRLGFWMSFCKPWTIKHFHFYYHRKLGRGEAKSWAGFLEKGTLPDWIAFRKTEAKGIWNHSDIYSYRFAGLFVCLFFNLQSQSTSSHGCQPLERVMAISPRKPRQGS